MEYILKIENLKCGGCENSIINALSKIANVQTVKTNLSTSEVDVQGKGFDRKKIVEKLNKMGYPLVGNNNLLKKIISHIGCALGKIKFR